MSYLNLHHHYNLGVGIKASEEGSVERLCQTVACLTPGPSPDGEGRSIKEIYQERCAQMLADKIDYAKFLTYFIENYPASVGQSKKADKAFWERFK